MFILYILIALLITLPITTFGFYNKKNLPGIFFCLLLAIPAWFLGQWLPIVGGPVIGLVLGMLLAQFSHLPAASQPGIKETGKRILQTAIMLLGFQMSFAHFLYVGSQAIFILLAVITTALILAYLLGKRMGISKNEQTLIGVGTAICGGSAIAATAPIIKADDKQVATAIATIFLFNVIAVFVFPTAGHLLGMDEAMFGTWAGAAINDTSSVTAAGFAYGDVAGGTAIVVKLTRTLMIIPVTLLLALKQSKQGGNGELFKIHKNFPWFVAGFMAACVLNTIGVIPTEATMFWGMMGRFFIIVAMVGIGLNIKFKELFRHGKKPMALGFCLSLAVAMVSLVLIF